MEDATYRNVFVPQRFKDAIALHIVKNLAYNRMFRAPLILGIHGPPGEGKTFQCQAVLDEMQIRIVRLSGKDFESDRAGDPARLLSSNYSEASKLVSKGIAATLLINDLDAGIGCWGSDVQYTVNTQLVNATLMQIADYPESLGDGDYRDRRIPIIVTGNDFSKLYEPLTREGRMVSFSWLPTIEERIDIVHHSIFPDRSLTDLDVAKFVKAFPEMPVAFFALVRSCMYDEQVLDLIHNAALSTILHTLWNTPQTKLALPTCDLETLMRTGKTVVESRSIISHLGRRREESASHGEV